MDLTYQLSKHVDGFRAVCCEHPHLEGAGPTEDDALRSLRETVRDKFRHVEALAPPEDPPPVEVSLRRVEHPEAALPDGPGAPPSPDGPGAAPERASRPG